MARSRRSRSPTVPILGKIEDGNASDKTLNHGILGEVARHMHTHSVEEGAFIDVADSAMVTEANLEQAGERIGFVTRLPATYNEHEQVILRAIEADDWTEVGKIAQTPSTEHRRGASYWVSEGAVTLYGKTYRAAVVHSSAHDKRCQLAGCFVLLSNLPREDDDSAEQILRTDKEQHAIEKNFGFLKDDQIVNALFLERPERIEALGLILLIALLIWRLMALVMRTELQARGATIPGWDDKPTARPGAYMMTWKFKGVLVLCSDGQRMLSKPLTVTQEACLLALEVPVSCFKQHPRDG